MGYLMLIFLFVLYCFGVVMNCVIYVSPIGTSLLANFSRDKGRVFIPRYKDLGEWHKLSPSDDRNIYPSGSVCNALEDKEFIDALISYGIEFKERSCAEVNGVLGIQRIFGHRPENIEIFLLYTKTCNTRLTAYALRKVLVELGFQNQNIIAIDLTGIANVDEFDRGLVEILDKVSAIIKDGRSKNCRVYVNATPGFKAETAFVMLVSLLLCADSVIYVHESFNQPVIIPSLPLTIEVDKLKYFLDIFGKEDSIHINALLSVTTYEKFLEYKDKGLLKVEGEYVKLRPWIKALVEKINQRN